MYVGYVVFSYICVLRNTSNMIFILNFCFAHSVTHVGSAVAAQNFLGQLEMRQRNCAVHSICSVCGASILLLVHYQINSKIKSKQTSNA